MRKYAKDYKVVITEDKKGREKRTAVYQGKFYEINVEEKKLKALKLSCMILSILVISIHIGSGFVANPGMLQFYVALPYVFAFLPFYFLAAGTLRLPTEKRKFRRDEIELSFKRADTWGLILLIDLGVGVVGEIVFMIWFMDGWHTLELLYLLMVAVSAILIFILIRLLKPVLTKIVSTQEEQERRD
jgi:hypothetical protein